MFFEFESTNTNAGSSNQHNRNGQQTKSTNINEKSPRKSLLSIPSVAVTKPLSGSSPLSPLAMDSSSLSPVKSSNMTNPQRHRRYSMHSFQSTPTVLTLETLKENSSYCDLALITKKKLMSLSNEQSGNGGAGSSSCHQSPLKYLDERFIEPDIKLNQTFTKHSSSDLRKEVLLASIQRSLSSSTEDLNNSLSSNQSVSLSRNATMNDTMQITTSNETSTDCSNSSSNDDDYPMDTQFMKKVPNNQIELSTHQSSMALNSQHNLSSLSLDDSMLSLDSETQSIQNTTKAANNNSSQKGQLRSSSSSFISSGFVPSEHHVNLNSLTTLTTTTSMAGGSKNNNNCRQYIKNLNGPGLSMMGNNSCHYSHRTSSPNLACNTVQSSSPIRTSYKAKRYRMVQYSTSPSKYSSTPYHTTANVTINCNNNSNSIYSTSGASSSPGNLSPDWEMAFKRLKVMHRSSSPSLLSNEINELNSGISSTTSATNNSVADNNQQSDNMTQITTNRSSINHRGPQNKELNELAQDFHRLKTPFT